MYEEMMIVMVKMVVMVMVTVIERLRGKLHVVSIWASLCRWWW